MAALFEGTGLLGKAVNVELGLDKNDRPRVRWEMEVTEGEHKGKRAKYSGKLDPDNIKWTKMAMVRIGWKGKDVKTFVADVKAAALVIPFDAEIASNTYEDTGKKSEWTSARIVGGGQPLATPTDEKIKNMNDWFAEVGDVGGAEEDKIPF